MKISGLEKGILALTAAFLLLTAGYFWGQRSGAEPYTVSSQTMWTEEAAAQTQEESETEQQSEMEQQTGTEQQSEAEQQTETEQQPETEQKTERVNINTADAAELQTLPGIGQVRAERIIADREANGPFRIPEDITRVSGIGQGILEQILDSITVE